jgi:N-methylhydantoinase A
VLIPHAPGYFSAYGMLFSDLRYDFVRSVFRRLDSLPFDEIEAIYQAMEDEGRAAIAASQIRPDELVFERAADMRYVGQEHAVTVDLPQQSFVQRDRAGIKQHFDQVHQVRYGTSAPAEPADIVSLRVTVMGRMKKPPRHEVASGQAQPDANALRAHKPVYFRSAGDYVPTPVYRRELLKSGNVFEGPALVEEHASTTVVQPGDAVLVDAFGNLQISIGSDRT